MTLYDAVEILQCLLDQINNDGISAADLIYDQDRDEYAEALACVINICDEMLT